MNDGENSDAIQVADKDTDEEAQENERAFKFRSQIWQYFQYDEKSDKSLCLKAGCKASIKGKFSTNLRTHLKLHPKEFAEYEKKEKETKAAKEGALSKVLRRTKGHQRNITEMLSGGRVQKYAPTDKRQVMLRKRLSLLLGSTSIPTSIVENEEFRSYINCLDPKHELPRRMTATKELVKLSTDTRSMLKKLMDSSPSRIHLSLDLWTKKGFTSSYLGTTANFLVEDHSTMTGNQKKKKWRQEHCVLELIEFPSPHTGERITQEILRILQAWDLGLNRVGFCLTDSGANIVKAFKDLKALLATSSTCTDVSSSQEGAQNDLTITAILDGSDCEVMETDQNEVGDAQEDPDPREPSDPSPTISTSEQDNNDDAEVGQLEEEESEDEDDYVVPSAQLEEESRQLESEEVEMTKSMQDQGINRLDCYSHKLQLVMVEFDLFRQTRGKSRKGSIPLFAKAIAKAKKIVAKFNKSSTATQMLIEKMGKKLCSDSPTRWSSTYILIERFLQLKPAVEEICDKLKWNSLSNTQWNTLQSIEKLLKPFAAFTQLLSGSKTVTLSSVLLSVLELDAHLQEMSKVPGLKGVSEALLAGLKRRFSFMLDEEDSKFDATFMISTFLDPNLKHLLPDDMLPVVHSSLHKSVKWILNTTDGNPMVQQEHSEAPTAPSQNGSTQTSEQSEQNGDLSAGGDALILDDPAERFHLLVAKQKASRSGQPPAEQTPSSIAAFLRNQLDKERELYWSMAPPKPVLLPNGQRVIPSSLEFWCDNATVLPTLSKAAATLLSCPASSAGSEREFSIAGWLCGGRRNRLSGENLAAEVMLSSNIEIIRQYSTSLGISYSSSSGQWSNN